jgi:hypothetical protein
MRRTASYRGARASNAGDRFHELWALRQALRLLDGSSRLFKIKVEGVDDDQAADSDYDAVDVALYYGSESAIDRIEVVQVKYSPSRPNDSWTIAKAIRRRSKSPSSSVVGGLGRAYKALRGQHPTLSRDQFVTQLVTNQRISEELTDALLNCRKGEHDRRILDESGLGAAEFSDFASTFELVGGAANRFQLEQQIVKVISGWTEDEGRLQINELKQLIQRRMLPEEHDRTIKREDILGVFQVIDSSGLFPCPPKLESTQNYVTRASVGRLASALSDNKKVCLHGAGGCGKTTVVQALRALLPTHSVVITYDCYGGGSYMDSDGARHRVEDAVLQIANELAASLSIPWLLTRKEGADYAKALSRRLALASNVLAATDPKALLVLAVDAADNAVAAARAKVPQERPFVYDFLRIGAVPNNVRLLITARSGHLGDLQIPPDVRQEKLEGFSLQESAAFVRASWPDASEAWIADFHRLSNGIPRVQAYALTTAAPEFARAMDYLLPEGKILEDVFRDKLAFARKKIGVTADLSRFCAAVAALPRPIPLPELAAISEISEAAAFDLVSDLRPGMSLLDGYVRLSDEDFERFLGEAGERHASEVAKAVAQRFWSRHQQDAYASAHVAHALYRAGEARKAIELISYEGEPKAIKEPITRRQAYLERLRVALTVCKESGSDSDALWIMLQGAAALRATAAVRKVVTEHPALAARFAAHSVRKLVLLDPGEEAEHGPAFFQAMAHAARLGDRPIASLRRDQLRAWLTKRADLLREREAENYAAPEWQVDDSDIAAETEAALLLGGPRAAIGNVYRWRPRTIALAVCQQLVPDLIRQGDANKVSAVLAEPGLTSPWDLLLLIPLALSGAQVDLARVEKSLRRLSQRPSLIGLSKVPDTGTKDHAIVGWLGTVIAACELMVARGHVSEGCLSVLRALADPSERDLSKSYRFQMFKLDPILRAHALLCAVDGSQVPFWVEPPLPPEDPTLSHKEKKVREHANSQMRETKEFFGQFQQLYKVRADILHGAVRPEGVVSALAEATGAIERGNYRYFNNPDQHGAQISVAASLTALLLVPGVSLASITPAIFGLAGKYQLRPKSGPLALLTLRRDFHGDFLQLVAKYRDEARGARISAERKANDLLDLAEAVCRISSADAEALFAEAISATNELDVDVVSQLKVMLQLSSNDSALTSKDERMLSAQKLADVIEDAAIRLEDYDHFPWSDSVAALTTLYPSEAIAAIGRWDDQDVASYRRLLPDLIESLLNKKLIAGVTAAALLPLFEAVDDDLAKRILSANRTEVDRRVSDAVLMDFLSDEAKHPRLRHNLCLDYIRDLSAAPEATAARERTLKLLEFQKQLKPLDKEKTQSIPDTQYEHLLPESVGADGQLSRDVLVSLVAAVKSGLGDRAFFYNRDVLLAVIARIAPAARTQFLSSLVELAASEEDPEILKVIVVAVSKWSGQPAVESWAAERLPGALTKHLAIWVRWGEQMSHIGDALALTGLPPQGQASLLVDAVQASVDQISGGSLYYICQLIAGRLLPAEAARTLLRYSDFLYHRVDSRHRRALLADLPESASDAVPRLVLALLGDVDLRVRWRAAHVVRRMARYRDIRSLAQLSQGLKRTKEVTFRDPKAPFYWCASRLWLAIAFSRVASEAPGTLASLAPSLLATLTDRTFPHSLFRSYIGDALHHLVRAKVIPRGKQALIARINRPKVPRRTKQRRILGARDDWGNDESRRFHFDSLDTLPYWYVTPASFFDISRKKFLERAEAWIIDRWGASPEIWRWDDEPRKGKLSRDSMKSYHGHGSLPTVERYSTHLEWHAMWCVVGELLETHSLVKPDSSTDLKEWIDRYKSDFPLWLSDIRGVKPRFPMLWEEPSAEPGAWVGGCTERELLEFLCPVDSGIVVDADYRTTHPSGSCQVRIDAALIDPETALAFLRAGISHPDPWSWLNVTDLEEGTSRFRLEKLTQRRSFTCELEEEDPLRKRTDTFVVGPDALLSKLLRLRKLRELTWLAGKIEAVAFEAWSDSDEGDDRQWVDRFRSDGSWTRCGGDSLLRALKKTNRWMVFKLHVTKRVHRRGYRDDDDSETAKEKTYQHFVALTHDAQFFSHERSIGAWPVPR